MGARYNFAFDTRRKLTDWDISLTPRLCVRLVNNRPFSWNATLRHRRPKLCVLRVPPQNKNGIVVGRLEVQLLSINRRRQ